MKFDFTIYPKPYPCIILNIGSYIRIGLSSYVESFRLGLDYSWICECRTVTVCLIFGALWVEFTPHPNSEE